MPVTWHLIEGEGGCRYAVERGCVAVVVDALRASATAAMLLDAGATEILAVREIEDALAAKEEWSDALLFGERGGLPPEGFDGGNSPRETGIARGRRVIFTTTTGAGRLVAAADAPAAYMGTTINASAVAEAAAAHGRDVVVIPAGLTGQPDWDAQEDWVAAVCIARLGRGVVGEGAGRFDAWCRRIDDEGLEALFQSAPHAEKLRRVGLDEDIAYCAGVDLTRAVPRMAGRHGNGVLLRRA
jgi:2-phosphosulfolactate phosphatase